MPRKAKGLQYFYHVTDENWLNKKILSPKKPLLMDEREPEIERICVAPTLSGCLSAINFFSNQTLKVYRTMEKVESYVPYRVADSKITGERWLMSPTWFEHVLTLPKDVVKDIPCNAIRGGEGNELIKQAKERQEITKIIKEKYGHLGFC